MSSIKNEDKDSLFSKSSKKFQGTGDSQQIPNSISMKSFSSKSNAEDEKAALYKKQIELTIQELKNGNLTSGFEDLSLTLKAVKLLYKETSRRYYDEFLFIVETVCEVAEDYRSKKNFEKCAEILENILRYIKADTYLNQDALIHLRNHQAYLWKSMGKLSKALAYLQKSENILKANKHDLLSGVTYLNMSSILSQMNKYRD